MPIKNEREYRNLGKLEIRAAAEGDPIENVVGYASTFDTYELFEEPGVGKVYERIDPRAFDGADLSDVVFLRDHTGRVLARTKNGSVKLSTDEHGLLTDTFLGLTTASKEMLEDIRVGNYTQMSFSFTVDADHWENNTRVIDRIKKLYDISAVAFPANPFTDIGLSARDLFHGEMEKREAERLKAEQRERQRKRLALQIQLLKEESTDGNQRNEA